VYIAASEAERAGFEEQFFIIFSRSLTPLLVSSSPATTTTATDFSGSTRMNFVIRVFLGTRSLAFYKLNRMDERLLSAAHSAIEVCRFSSTFRGEKKEREKFFA
jgi:hypothetical protein